MQRKINRLDDDKVDNLSLPILFGVTLGMIWPNFGDSRDGGARVHEGEDIMAPEGAPVVSPTEAVVTRVGTGAGSGKYVTTANPGGETFQYYHLSEILVKSGDELNVGELLGYVGNTGNASGGAAHLHFEIRKGRTATDPFPRLTREFSVKDKIEYLDDALDTLDDDAQDDLAKFVVANYTAELRNARTSGIALPKDVNDMLGEMPTVSAPGVFGPLQAVLGSQGPLVSLIQQLLIIKNTGPAAKTLAGAGATGYFGPITEGALIEYQTAHGITPANGFFGSVTLTYMLTSEMK